MSTQQDFHGPNAGYVLELYEQYQQSPESVDPATRRFFENWTPPTTNGAPSQVTAAAPAADVDVSKIVGAVNLAQFIRQYGHLGARLDPLGTPPTGDPELEPAAYGITDDDLRDLPASLISSPATLNAANALEAIETLRYLYCNTTGYDFEHIRIPEERQWLRDAVESRRYCLTNDADRDAQSVVLLQRLAQVETFELFLQNNFPTKYRFSIEGLDMMVPMLDELVERAVGTGMSTIAIAMAHRGRLNVLAHIMKKPYVQIMAEFKDPMQMLEVEEAIGWTVGDVKYHKGVRREVESGHATSLVLTMPPNPSHLEVVNPVAVGMARAAGTHVDQRGEPTFDPTLTMQVLIHGDAAFPGQGIVSETFNLERLPGYWTGGTIHIIANNQLGFTTDPLDGRSTLYASDLAKGFKVPIIHVNADDPEACIEAMRIAFAYQMEFEKDFLIDLIGYRRYGHNELDEPSFTQPLMYKTVRSHPTARQLWSRHLIERGVVTEAQSQAFVNEFNAQMKEAFDSSPDPEELVDAKPTPPPPGAARQIETAVTLERLHAINDSLRDMVTGFNFFSKRLQNTLLKRREAFNDAETPAIDWATAEELAFATILEEKIAIRLTGQDSERGTFSHRHAVLHDADTGDKLTPLQLLPQARAAFEIHNSPLSEGAVLGFEYGYNVQEPNRLVVWEAQYGDFDNNAQVIIDEFIMSAREKWGQTPSLVMLLPHGHEGAGPDHSSARPERFLQLAAKTNCRIAYCTTAAQYFHLLRRQALLLSTDPLPLIVMSPKSLLRAEHVMSPAVDLTTGKWRPVLDDPDAEPDRVDRLVLCTGKFYYDLVKSEYRDHYPNVALVRLEQLYPFPLDGLRSIIEQYPNIRQIVWAQEEPKNMGAWEFMSYRIKRMVGIDMPVNYVGRRRSSSPAEGSSTAHKVNQAMIVEYAFNWDFALGKSVKK